jgi:HAD superfamily hydrolase (TIGR01484 family)
MPSRYDLIALDLDGTLLCGRGRVSERNLAAIRRAREAGLKINVCTGRGYNECKHIARQIDQVEPLVVAGGSIVTDAANGCTLHRFSMNRDLVSRLVSSMTSHGHAALVLKDPSPVTDSGLRDHHEYLIVSPSGEDAVDPVSRWWFKEHDIRFKVVDSLEHDEHPELTVRVGVCGSRRQTAAAAHTLHHEFANEVVVHHFHAVAPIAGGAGVMPAGDDQIVVLEAFDRAVSKWNAISWLAHRDGIDPNRICAIGNDVNDIAMLQGAALGIAVGNAIPEAKAVAKRHTCDNDADGVAHAIDMILAGEW